MFRVLLDKQATKSLQKIPRKIASNIITKIEDVAASPYAINNNVKRLKGEDNYRLRVGYYRVVYYIIDDEMIIKVIRVSHRKDVYK